MFLNSSVTSCHRLTKVPMYISLDYLRILNYYRPTLLNLSHGVLSIWWQACSASTCLSTSLMCGFWPLVYMIFLSIIVMTSLSHNMGSGLSIILPLNKATQSRGLLRSTSDQKVSMLLFVSTDLFLWNTKTIAGQYIVSDQPHSFECRPFLFSCIISPMVDSLWAFA